MPLEWAKALRPTIALLNCTGILMSDDTMRLVGYMRVVLMLKSNGIVA